MKPAKVIKPKRLVQRSWDGLRDALFDELDGLRSSNPRPQIANSAARLAAEITKSAAVQASILKLSGRKNSIAGKVPLLLG